MSEITFGPGDLVFAEGSPSDSVLRITDDEAEALKVMDGSEVVLGRLKPGDYVGEMGVLEGRPRGATVRAVSALTVERFGREEFLAQVSRDSVIAFKLLVRLSERLNALDQSFASLRPERAEVLSEPPPPPQPVQAAPGPAPAAEQAAQIVLRPDSEILAAILPVPEIAVERLPYNVGRTPAPGEAAPRARIDLTLDDARPYRLSRAHFRIEQGVEGYRLRDLGSVLGTQVNGVAVGHHFASDVALLEQGENEVVAGGQDSPYRFRLTLKG